MDNKKTKDMNSAFEFIGICLENGNYDQGLETLQALARSYTKMSIPMYLNLGGMYIDYGQSLQKEDLIIKGLSYLTNLHALDKSISNEAIYNYNIANGYLQLFSTKYGKKRKKLKPFTDYKELEIAKKYYQKAIQLNPTPQLYTNYGNLLDTLGRIFEAIQYYKKALAMDPNFGMARGNIAIALKTLADISTADKLGIYQQAYKNLTRSLELEQSVLDFGGKYSLEQFRIHKKKLEEKFKEKPSILTKTITHKKYNTNGLSDFEKFYYKYSIEHDMYLNLHIDHKDCIAAITDDIFISLVTSVKDTKSFYRLGKKINEIKESYATARLLLIQSQFRTSNLSNISKQTMLIYPLDYSSSNIYLGLLKASFKECFNLLDKIIYFLDDYLKLKIAKKKRIDYRTFWYEGQNSRSGLIAPKLLKQENYLLYGIYSMMIDLFSDEYRHIRNHLTHLNVYLYYPEADPEIIDGTDHIYIDDFTELNNKLFEKLKMIIITLIHYVNVSENAKKSSSKGLIAPLAVSTEQFLDI